MAQFSELKILLAFKLNSNGVNFIKKYNISVVHPRDPGSNLGVDIIFSDSVSNSNL